MKRWLLRVIIICAVIVGGFLYYSCTPGFMRWHNFAIFLTTPVSYTDLAEEVDLQGAVRDVVDNAERVDFSRSYDYNIGAPSFQADLKFISLDFARDVIRIGFANYRIPHEIMEEFGETWLAATRVVTQINSRT